MGGAVFRKSRGRVSRRERIEAVNKGLRHWGAMFGKPEVAESLVTQLPPKREYVRRPAGGNPAAPLEKEIQKAIIEAIELRRDVVFVGRFNRGQAVATDEHGHTRYTPFNSVKGFPDLHGLLVGGKAFYLEVKRPHPFYVKPREDQQGFLDAARNAGAYAGVVTSVEEAMAVLP